MVPERRCSSIMPARPLRLSTGSPEKHGMPMCLWRCWAPATTPTPGRPGRAGYGTGSARTCAPELNPTYNDLAVHYGVGILPARPYHARDKAKVEAGVQVVQRWVLAALRKRQFFSLAE